MVVFCQVDTQLVQIIQKVADGRVVIDCGAGEALLHEQMPSGSVISLDILDRGNPNVTQYDCSAWIFRPNQFPIVIRPCHSGFVEDTLLIAYAMCDFALYIGLEENRVMDLGIFSELSYIIHDEWTGEDGEKIWLIPFKQHYAGGYNG